MSASHPAPTPDRAPPSRVVTASRILLHGALPPRQYGMSYPKSGRTWLRAMIGHVLCARTGIGHEYLLSTRVLVAAAGLQTLKWHHGGGSLKVNCVPWDALEFNHRLFDGKRILFLMRDPRDTLVSAYFHATKRIRVFEGDIAAFVRSSERGILKWIAYHNMWHANRELLRSFRLVTYESLHATPVPALRSAIEAIGLDDTTDAELEAAIEFARFENLKKLEEGAAVRKAALRPKDQDDPESFKVRKGRVGGYRQSLSEEDIAYIDGALAANPCPLYQQNYTAS